MLMREGERERKGGNVKKKGQKAEGKERGKEQERKKDKKEGRQDKGRKRWNIWKHCKGLSTDIIMQML